MSGSHNNMIEGCDNEIRSLFQVNVAIDQGWFCG